MACFGPREESPLQRFVLPVILPQRERCHRLGHFVAQVEGMRRVKGLAGRHGGKEFERVIALEVSAAAQSVQPAIFGGDDDLSDVTVRSEVSNSTGVTVGVGSRRICTCPSNFMIEPSLLTQAESDLPFHSL